MGSHGTVQHYTKSQFYGSSEVDENSVVDISSVKLVDESSVLVENTGLKLEELDEKAVVYQSVFSPKSPIYDLAIGNEKSEQSIGKCFTVRLIRLEEFFFFCVMRMIS